MKKASNKKLCADFLRARALVSTSKGYAKQKWIVFCETMMADGFVCYLYEARRTASKYITVKHPDNHSRSFKVRFSNHRPIKHRETAGDCDFFVGVNNTHTTTTDQAIERTLSFFKGEKHD